MNLSYGEIKLIVEELQEFIIPARVQKIFEDSPNAVVLQLRVPGQTHHLLLSARDDDSRLHLVESKPNQPDHPSPFTMQLRKWLHGAWIEQVLLGKSDRIVHFDLQAIDPDWEPKSEDEKAPRIALTLIAELLGRHPNLFLVDAEGVIIGSGPGNVLGDRDTSIGAKYDTPPPPPDWADEDKVRACLEDLPPDGSRSDALADHFEQTVEERERVELTRSLRSRLKSRAKKLRRRVANIEGDLEHIEDADEYRRRGELLQTAYGDLEAGADCAVVPDFYQEGMPDVEIPLDPSRSLQKNIEYYFHQYRRYSAAKTKVESRLLESMELSDRVEQARERLTELVELDDFDALESFAAHLEAEKLLPSKRRRRSSGPREQRALPPYREFRAHSGAAILVGRGPRRNDKLTTHVARGRDIWLHTRDWTGAHVILRVEKNSEIHSEDLIDAAILAAQFSKGRHDTIIDVSYTKAKYVRKPRGAAPGLVTFGGGSNLAVRIEDKRLQRLMDSEVDLS